MSTGGRTVLEKAVIEHNVLACSRLYNNIRISELARLLGISARDAESLAWQMIKSKRLDARIDQMEESIEFENSKGTLMVWDEGIQHVCNEINGTLDALVSKYPRFDY